MEGSLIIRNVGPLKDVQLDLKSFMVIIGPQSTGKSIIAKIVSVIGNTNLFTKKSSFKALCEAMLISNFFSNDSYIKFHSTSYSFELKDGVENLEIENIDELKEYYDYIASKDWTDEALQKIKDSLEDIRIRSEKSQDDEEAAKRLHDELKELEKKIDRRLKFQSDPEVSKLRSAGYYGYYIPAERSLIPIILNSILSFNESKVSLPEPLLRFGVNYENARKKLTKFEIPFFKNFTYSFSQGNDTLTLDTGKELKLIEASSGIQSMLPLLLVFEYLFSLSTTSKTISNFVIEEPEQNIYPEMQYALLKHIVSRHNMNTSSYNILITTHSPYVLSSVNNFLLANQIKKSKRADLNIETIDPHDFNAYFICDGKANSIFDSKLGLISENELDAASEVILNDFEFMMDALKNTPHESSN
jgi:predicted ATPase